MSNVMNSHLADLAPVEPVQIEISKEVLRKSGLKNVCSDCDNVSLIEIINDEMTLSDGREIHKFKLNIKNNVWFKWYLAISHIRVSQLIKGFTLINTDDKGSLLRLDNGDEFPCKEYNKGSNVYNIILSQNDAIYEVSFKDFSKIFETDKAFRKKGKKFIYKAVIDDDNGSVNFIDKFNDENSCEIKDCVEVKQIKDGYRPWLKSLSMPHNFIYYLNSLNNKVFEISKQGNIITSDGSIFAMQLN